MQGIFQKENTDKALKYGIYRHLPTYEKIIRNLVSFYYTEKEQKCFTEWCKSLKNPKKTMLDTVLEEIQTLSDESEQVHFLTRLLSKVPFFNPVFPKAVMNDFGKMVNQKIDGIRKKKDNIEMINNIFVRSIEEETFDAEILSNMIYKKIMEE